MFSPEFMKYLISYQKDDFAPQDSEKEIDFKDNNGGKLAEVRILAEK